MCGIAGIVDLGRGADAEALAAMSAALVHRGPDDDGTHLDGPVGLAARRLAIIDLAHGHQPIATEDGDVVVVQNGEIYNHEALREDLQHAGHTFATRCDTEVIAHGYEEWGDEVVQHLRGMFALAVWDRRRRRLLLARDAFGIKPLYWTAPGRALAFASELKALRHAPGFSREVDVAAVEAFLAHNAVPAPLTAYSAARKLEPGHLLVWENGRTTVRCWRRPRPVEAGQVRREDGRALAEELRDRLRDAVRAHLVADVPVGVLLSGGIDSGLLTALAAEETPQAVHTFSVGFEEKSFDELEHARAVAERYGTRHHEMVLRPDAAALMPEIAGAFDEPFADSSALPTYLVCRLASEHVKVVLSGEGGDELFGGYETYVADLLAARAGRPLALLNPLAERLPSSSARVSVDYKLKRFTRAAHLDALEAHHGWKEIFSADARGELLGDRAAGTDVLAAHRAAYEESAGAEPLARLQHVDTAVYLADDLLVKTDRCSMAHSLEARVPFLDPVVAELAHALPTAMKVRGRQKKRLLRDAAEPLLPRGIVRGRKRGFSIPAAAWLRGELEPFAREVLSPERVGAQGWLEPAAVTRVLEDHVSGREDLSRQLWGLMALSLWQDA